MAESAVFDAIESSDEVSPRTLVIETAKALVRRRKNSAAPILDGAELLPFELQRLLLLHPLLRDSFVLRVLAGLSPEVCAEILEVSIPDCEDALLAALPELPHLESRDRLRRRRDGVSVLSSVM